MLQSAESQRLGHNLVTEHNSKYVRRIRNLHNESREAMLRVAIICNSRNAGVSVQRNYSRFYNCSINKLLLKVRFILMIKL